MGVQQESLVTIRAAGEILSASKSKIYSLIGEGKLIVVRLGPHCVRIRRSSLNALIA
jgi:excisionase family DNA binding protein